MFSSCEAKRIACVSRIATVEIGWTVKEDIEMCLKTELSESALRLNTGSTTTVG